METTAVKNLTNSINQTRNDPEQNPQTKRFSMDYTHDLGCGNVYDNAAVLARAQWVIERGDIERGVAMLCALRDFILRTRENKSVVWVLPVVEHELEIHEV